MKISKHQALLALLIGSIAATADAAKSPRPFTLDAAIPKAASKKSAASASTTAAAAASAEPSKGKGKKAIRPSIGTRAKTNTRQESESRDANPLELVAAAISTRRVELGVCVGLWYAAWLVRNARARRAIAGLENPPGVNVRSLDGSDAAMVSDMDVDVDIHVDADNLGDVDIDIDLSDIMNIDVPLPEFDERLSASMGQPPVYSQRPEQVVVEACDPYMEVPTSEQPNVQVEMMDSDLNSFMDGNMMRGGQSSNTALEERLKVGFYFFVWYALNVMYNIVNKKVLQKLPAPLMVGTVQLGIGAVYVGLMWLLRLRPTPQLTAEGKSKITQVGLYHSLGQLASTMSLGAGPVSFTHIVKALEPFFSAIVSGFYFSKWMRPQVYSTLIPVVGGVGYACLKERHFSWLAFSAAMFSNVAFALRAVVSKIAMQSGRAAGTDLTPPNMFGVVTWAAFLLSLPLAIIAEGGGIMKLLTAALDKVDNKRNFLVSILISGLLHYLNNEVMYLALGSVHPVTLAVGNTMKRVFIMVASIIVFQNPISVQAGIGSAVGISGVLLYSLTKQHYEAVEAKEKEEAAVAANKIFRPLPKLGKNRFLGAKKNR